MEAGAGGRRIEDVGRGTERLQSQEREQELEQEWPAKVDSRGERMETLSSSLLSAPAGMVARFPLSGAATARGLGETWSGAGMPA